MNDTEADARRLLAPAVEDRPPGIDLLAGFDAARRRDRTRRLRGRAVLSAGVAAVAASVTAVTLTVGSAPSPLATVTTALTRTLTQSYHITRQNSSYTISNGRIRSPSHLTCTSVVDPVHNLSASSCQSGAAEGVERVVGGYLYSYVPHIKGHPSWHWQRVQVTEPGGQGLATNGFFGPAPQQLLSEIKKAEKVTAAGPASGPGWTGTRYVFSFSGPGGSSGTVDVDRQGRIRILILRSRTTTTSGVFVLTNVFTFSDYGAPVTVTPPPANQTFSTP
jgi:hypothetical protein